MKRSTFVVMTILAAATILFGVFAWLQKSESLATGALATGVMLTIFIVMPMLSRSDEAAAFLARHGRRIVTLGWIVAGVGVAACIVASVVLDNQGWPIFLGVAFVMLGSLTGTLIKAAPQYRADVAAAERQLRRPPPPGGFGGVAIADDALRAIGRESGVAARIALPWLGLLAAAAVGLGLIDGRGLAPGSTPGNLAVLGVLLLMLVGFNLMPAMLFVAWSRWTVQGVKPPWGVAVPGRATVAVAWKGFFFLLVLGFGFKVIERLLGKAADQTVWPGAVVSDVVWWGLLLIALGVFSPMALRLTATAVKDKMTSPTELMMGGRRLWPGLPVALMLTATPWLFGNLALGSLMAMSDPPTTPTAETLLRAPVLAFIVAMAALVTLSVMWAAGVLGRAYLAVTRD